MELLSLYGEAAYNEADKFEKYSNEVPRQFEERREFAFQSGFDRFADALNEIFSQFSVNYKLTRLGFVPKIDAKVIENIYEPVIQTLSSPTWREVNLHLREAFEEYRRNTPEAFSTSVTKAVTALQAYLQILVHGRTGKGNLDALINEAQKKKVIPDDNFSSNFLNSIKSTLMAERQNTGDAHPRKNYANEKNSRLVLNLVMVFLQHCLS